MPRQHRSALPSTIGYYLALLFRLALFSAATLAFAGVGLADAGLRLLWPAWRSREHASRWVSKWFPRLATRIFPLILVVPCSWHRRYQVGYLRYPRRLHPGELAWVEFSLRNNSAETWRGEGLHPLRVGIVTPVEGSAFYVAEAWLDPTRPAELQAGSEVRPSTAADFRIPIQAPRTPGRYRETWGPLIEGRGWLPTVKALDVHIEVARES